MTTANLRKQSGESVRHESRFPAISARRSGGGITTFWQVITMLYWAALTMRKRLRRRVWSACF